MKYNGFELSVDGLLHCWCVAPDDTAYKCWNCHSGFGKLLCKLCQNLPISDICHKEIHGRKRISIWFNTIEQWMHLR